MKIATLFVIGMFLTAVIPLHQEIKKHSRELKRVEDLVVKRYDVVS